MDSPEHVTSSEDALLALVSRGIPAETQERYDELIARRESECLTADEHQELLWLTDEIEMHDAQRIEWLSKLAKLRGMSLTQLMSDLHIDYPAVHD